jgi:3-phenylpropionate/trans-cinnamate dioxygenase ferredoxin reductase subunit
MRTRSFATYYLRQERLIAVDAVNSPRDFMQGKKLLASGVAVPVEVLADAEADLTRFLA